MPINKERCGDSGDICYEDASDKKHWLNSVIYYTYDGKDCRYIFLHVPNTKKLRLSSHEKLHLFEQGLRDLAKVIVAHNSVETVRGISWIVNEHPKIIKRLGFTIGSSISREAHMAREDFLARYLKKDTKKEDADQELNDLQEEVGAGFVFRYSLLGL